MYHSQTTMAPCLMPEQYWQPQWHEDDVKRLKLAGWHLIATTSQLANSGDYVAETILGVPVVVRRFEDQLVGFRNVCAHRHCPLVDEGAGCSTEMKCRYHGWHYGSDGRTRRIPGATNFPKFDREAHRLEIFNVQCMGQLVFVKLASDVPDLSEWLGSFADTLVQATSLTDWTENLNCRLDYAADWKIVVEGTLESYHLDEVHPKTFGTDPGEQGTMHIINDGSTVFETDTRPLDDFEAISLRWLTGDFNRSYRHIHLFPNLMVSLTDTLTLVCQCEPLAPGQSGLRVMGFGRSPRRQDWARRLWAWGMRRVSAKVALKVLAEDAEIFPRVQSGKRKAIDAGIFGRCEERLDAFHRYWANTQVQGNEATTGAQSVTNEPLTMDLLS